ncbi:MAG: Shikimate dehydrogenase [Ramlibacter sp.]|jgi:shikimate dehydrogenase|nr:Shikimate dehydrogenase [Ramlibacter sp.]
MLDTYSGATRVYFIIGDPIAQAKAPRYFTQALRANGVDAVVVPAHVGSADLAAFFATATAMRNCDGVVVTVPHKFDALAYCEGATPRARSIGGVNVMRRTPTGGWWGDQVDGEGYLAGLRAKGCDPAGRKVLLVGAGGAGSAIARSLADAGVAWLALHDADPARRDELLAKLADSAVARPAGSADPTGFDIVINATPLGMGPDDALPLPEARLAPGQFVGEVVAQPEVTALIAAARARGCRTMTGMDMFNGVLDRMVDFYAPRS